MEIALIVTVMLLIKVSTVLARRTLTWTWIFCPSKSNDCPSCPALHSDNYCFKLKHLIHSFYFSLFRLPLSLCLVTYKATVLVGTLRPKNTAGKTSGDTAMAKEGWGVVKEFPTPGPASLWYWFHSLLLNRMASPHQGSLAPNQSAFNFTQEGLTVGRMNRISSCWMMAWNPISKSEMDCIYSTQSRASSNPNHLPHNHSKNMFSESMHICG